MAPEVSKRKVLRTLSNRYICRTIPLLHTVILLIEMGIVARIVYKFNSYYADRPILTMMITNAILSGIADTVAQSISAIHLRRTSGNTSNQIPLAIEIHELDQKNSPTLQEISPDVKSQLPSFDFERLSRFMAYGCMMAPIQFKWFKFLSKSFPITKQNGLESALKMMALDQLIFAPAGIATFFTVMTIAEGGGRRAVSTKLRDMYLPTLKANFVVWPLVQMVNFRLMPLQFQLPFVSTISIAWTVYLSLSNASEDADVRSTPQSPNFRLQ